MNNQKKLKSLIANGSFELSGSGMENNLNGVEIDEMGEKAMLWFHGKKHEKFANFCANKFKTKVVSPAPNHYQVLTKTSNLK